MNRYEYRNELEQEDGDYAILEIPASYSPPNSIQIADEDGVYDTFVLKGER